ncbi:hypothetical protein ACLOJK_032498 [Asimina triloba]
MQNAITTFSAAGLLSIPSNKIMGFGFGHTTAHVRGMDGSGSCENNRRLRGPREPMMAIRPDACQQSRRCKVTEREYLGPRKKEQLTERALQAGPNNRQHSLSLTSGEDIPVRLLQAKDRFPRGLKRPHPPLSLSPAYGLHGIFPPPHIRATRF